MVKDGQVRILMRLMNREKTLGTAAAKAGMTEKTARKYRDLGQLPSQGVVHHALRTCLQAKRFYDKKLAKRNGALATKALAAKWSKAAYYMMQRQEAFDLTRVFG